MAGLRPFINGIMIILLFGICLLLFMLRFIETNNPESQALANPVINQSIAQLNRTIESFQQNAQNAQELLGQDEPSATTYLFLIFKSAYYIPLSFLNIIGSGLSFLTGITFQQLLGVGSSPFYLAFAVVNTILVLTAVFLIIQSIRTGQSER